MKLIARLMLSMTAIVLASSVSATVITFDDHPNVAQNSWGAIGTYDGFTFKGGNDRLDWIDTVGSYWNYGAVSGDFTMLNNYGGTGVITAANGSDFTFDGLWAETWGRASARNAYIEGYNNGALVWVSTIVLNPTFSYFDGMSGGIDELRLNFGNFFLVDNLALNESQVPEPASLSLFGLALAGLVVARRCKSA